RIDSHFSLVHKRYFTFSLVHNRYSQLSKPFQDKDSNLFIISNNINTLFNVANSEVNSLFAWIDANKLFINYDKTNFMLFQPRDGKYSLSQDASNLPSLKINDHFIN